MSTACPNPQPCTQRGIWIPYAFLHMALPPQEAIFGKSIVSQKRVLSPHPYQSMRARTQLTQGHRDTCARMHTCGMTGPAMVSARLPLFKCCPTRTST